MKEWLKENGIDMLKWPLYSPNLNPIEHLWFRLKKLVYSVRLDIEQVGGSAEAVREVLYKTLKRAWTIIESRIMDDLVRSMERRV